MNRKTKLILPLMAALLAVVCIYIGKISVGTTRQTIDALPLATPNKLQSVIDVINQYYVDNVSTDSIIESIIPEMLESLDPHSVYIPAKDIRHVNEELKSDFGGIGVTFTIREDTINVISVVAGGPSSMLGVQPGDKIIKVNGHDFVGPTINNDMVMDSLRGDIGTNVDITVLRGGKSTIDYTITRGVIPMYSVQVSYMIDDEIGYIKIDRFAERTYEEMMQGIAKLQNKGCKSLIVDLRSNSGGLLDVVTNMCNEFLAAGDLIVYTEGRHHPRQEARANGKGACQDMDVVVLIDEFSASASEIFAGAMQDNDRGIVIGQRSFGKGLVQTQMQLADNSALRITIARYHTPSGRCIQRPYDHGVNDYYEDAYRRHLSGELFSADSVKLDTLQRYTTKKGRTVFGGGGIMPDVFMPRDSSKASEYLYQLRAKGIIYNFAIDYADKNRDELSAFGTEQLVEHLKKLDILPQLTAYARKKGLASANTSAQERRIMDCEVKAYIGRNVKDNDAFYPIINSCDDVVDKAIEIARSNLDNE